MKTRVATILLLSNFIWPAIVNAQLVNGSFEEPTITANLNFTGSFSFTGWSGFSTGNGTDGNAGIAVGTEFGLAPLDGNQAFSFNGNNPPPGTYIEQTFSTIQLESYTISFGIGRNSGFSDQTLALNAQVFDATGEELVSLYAQPPSSVSWATETFSFIADSTTSRLRFTDASSSNPTTDLLIDAVSVVPEPNTEAMLIVAGLSFLGSRFIRNRKNSIIVVE
jgi:hypothetical protein